MLELKNISLKIPNGTEDVEILKDINLTLEDEKFYAMTGPNGGGKTSLAKVIMGIYKNNSGRIILDGEDITDFDITERANCGISYAFQNPPRFKGIKVNELLKIAAKDNKDFNFRRLRSVGLCPQDYLNRECDDSLSGGEMKRIELATVMPRSSRVIMYDEPEAGVDLWSFENLLELIRKYHLKQKATSIVITHHEKVLSLADEIILVADGKIKEIGAREKILPVLNEDFKCKWQNDCGGNNDELKCY